MPSLLILFVLALASASSSTRNGAAKTKAPDKTATISGTSTKASQTKSAGVSLASTAPEIPLSIAKIKQAVGDLQMPSETDAPLRIEFWPSEKEALSPDEIALLAAVKPAEKVEITTVEKFFSNAALIEDGMSDDEKATAKQFQNLVAILNAELENPQVYLFGERERIVVIIGKVKGGFGGVVTLVVET